jgi:RsiW-degrading membrane proteinase PrsW (M82 family)
VFGAFALGAASVGLAALGYRLAFALGLPSSPGDTVGDVALYCWLTVGPVEELAKFAVLALVISTWREFDEEIDGLVYAAAVALGFASVENLLYLPHLPWPLRLARAAATPLSHAVFSGLFGFGVAWAKFRARSTAGRVLVPLATLAMAAAAHGAYDHVILAYGATLAAASVVAVLFVAMTVRARSVVEAPSLAVAALRATPFAPVARGGPRSRPSGRAS